MRKLPNCPICEDDELWTHTAYDIMKISCYECGWNVIIKLSLPITMDETHQVIADAVTQARRRGNGG